MLLNLSTIGAALFVAPLFRDHGVEPVYAFGGRRDGGGLLQLAVQVPALLKLAWSRALG